MYGSAGGVKCGPPDIEQVTDPTTGTLAMYFQYLASYVQGSTGKIWLQTDDFSSKTPGVGNYFNFPQASLIEITYRDNINDVHTVCDGIDSTAWWTWSHEGGAGADSVIEYDVVENFRAGINCSAQNTDSAVHNWNGDGNGNSQVSNAVWVYTMNANSPPDCCHTGNFANTGFLANNTPTDNYHTFGLLTTTDGTNVESCGYIDHNLVNCIPMPGLSRLCAESFSSQSGCFGQRDILLWWVGANAGSNALHADVKAWVKSWRVWSCPSWNAGSAIITTSNNKCFGAIISSEKAVKGNETKLADSR
jgi:hypothetical protein